MYYAYTKDHKTLFWASESWMLHVAMQRVGIDRDDIHFLTEGQLLTVDVPRVCGAQVDKIEHRQEGVDFYKSTQSREDEYSRSEEHTSELQSLMRISYAVFCLKKKNHKTTYITLLPASSSYYFHIIYHNTLYTHLFTSLLN